MTATGHHTIEMEHWCEMPQPILVQCHISIPLENVFMGYRNVKLD